MAQTPELDHKRKRDADDNNQLGYHTQQALIQQGIYT